MKYAILSDIHANAEALEAVLIDQHEKGCTHIACLGDIVGYGPDPKKCVDYDIESTKRKLKELGFGAGWR